MTNLTRQQMEQAYSEAGVREGSVVFVHSSLSSIGELSGGAQTVVAALRAVLGPRGTLAVPTFTFSRSDSVFDYEREPSQMGAISETVRRLPGALRSRHLLHSVAAVGCQAEQITAHHGPSAWGADGPFWQMITFDADILLLGVPYTRCTQFHVVEQIVNVDYREWQDREFAEQMINGVARPLPTRVYRPQAGFVGNDFNKFGLLLEERGLARKGIVGNAVTRLLRARDILETGVAVYRENREIFVKTGPFPTNVTEGVVMVKDDTERWVVDPSQVFTR